MMALPENESFENYPNLNRLCRSMVREHFPHLLDHSIRAVFGSDALGSPFLSAPCYYHEGRYEFVVIVDPSAPASIIRGGIAHELGHVSLDADRTLEELARSDELYSADPDFWMDEEVLAYAEGIRAGLSVDLWKTVRWCRSSFGLTLPMYQLRTAERFIEQL